jgi:hypothetical protein
MDLTWFQKVFRQEYAGWKPPQVPLLGPVVIGPMACPAGGLKRGYRPDRLSQGQAVTGR